LFDFGLAGKSLIVTGSASGIGRATSELAAAHGMLVAILDGDGESVSAVATNIRQAGGVAAGFVVDVRDRGGVRAAVNAIETELGPTVWDRVRRDRTAGGCGAGDCRAVGRGDRCQSDRDILLCTGGWRAVVIARAGLSCGHRLVRLASGVVLPVDLGLTAGYLNNQPI
jgi:NAD(P)-dependent dehydrogenase (short-subunit alcohol dehydrogenase family)